MISIPLVRRELTSDVIGRHIYQFGAGSAPMQTLQQLADRAAQHGTVVFAEADGAQLDAAVLFRPQLTRSAVPLFAVISTLAAAEAIGRLDACASPVWPDQVTIGDEPIARSLVALPAAFDRTSYVILGVELNVPALEARLPGPIDWNVVVAAFLNALDKWAMAYAEHGPAAIKAALQFLPRGSMPTSRAREDALLHG